MQIWLICSAIVYFFLKKITIFNALITLKL